MPDFTFTLTKLASMRWGRTGHSACVFGGSKILVSGGQHGESSRKCELYEVINNRWIDLADLNLPRYYHASCSFG